MIDTAYVRLSGLRRADGSAPGAEFRITRSEAHPERLEIGIYGHFSGDELATVEVSADDAVTLADALEAEGGTEVSVPAAWLMIRQADRRFQRWHEKIIGNGLTLHVIPLGPSGNPDKPWNGVGLDFEVDGVTVEECLLKPRRQRETAEALRAWLARS